MPRLSNDDLQRYDRQIRIEGWDQGKLSSSAVLVVGVGAIGCEVAKNLGIMGTGQLVLVDSDTVELSNLSRQMLFTDRDIGAPKATAAKKKIRRMNPSVRIEAHCSRVQELASSVLERADIICSCLDNWATRRWLNSVAVELGKPMVDGAMDGIYGNVQTIIAGETACIECHGDKLIPRDVQLAECTLKRRKPEDLRKDLQAEGIRISKEAAEQLFNGGFKTLYDLKYAMPEHVSKLNNPAASQLAEIQEKLMPWIPALQTVAAVMAGIQSHEVIKLLEGKAVGEVQYGLLTYDSSNQTVTTVELERNRNCFVCGDAFKTGHVDFTATRDERVLQLKESIAKTFGYPDPEVQFKTKFLTDEQLISEANVKSGDFIHVHTSRRLTPLSLRLILE